MQTKMAKATNKVTSSGTGSKSKDLSFIRRTLKMPHSSNYS